MANAPVTRNANERIADALTRQNNEPDLKTIFQGFGTPDQISQKLTATAQNPPTAPGQG
jgi:hypothetical protein